MSSHRWLPLFLFVLAALRFNFARSTEREKRNYDDTSKKVYMVGGIFGSDMRKSPMRAGFQYALALLAKQSSPYGVVLKPNVEFVDDITDSFQITTALCRLIADQVVAVFGPVPHQAAHTIQSLTDYYQLLYITPSDANHFYNADGIEQRGRYIVKLKPVLTGPIIDFITHEGWERIFYLYDSKHALLRLRSVFEGFNSRQSPLSTDVRELRGTNSSQTILKFIENKSKERKKHVLLDVMKTQTQQEILKQIKKMKLSRFDYHYLIIGVDINDVNITGFIHGGVNLTAFSQIDRNSTIVRNFIPDHWSQQNRRTLFTTTVDDELGEAAKKVLPYEAALMIDGVRVLAKALNSMKPQVQVSQLGTDIPCVAIGAPPYAADRLMPEIVRIGHEGLTGKVNFDTLGFRKNYKVIIYETRVKSSLNLIGSWEDNRSPNLKLSKVRYPVFKSDEPDDQKKRVVTSILVPPFLMEKKNKTTGKPIPGEYEGFCVDLIKDVAKKANFTYKIIVVEDGQFGGSVNGSWNGMIGELVNGKSDIAVAPLTITSSRERVVDFSTPFMEVGLSIMFKKPNNPAKDIFSFMEPLSNEIWMCIAFAYLGVSVVLFMVSRFNPEEWHQLHLTEADGEQKVTNDFSIFNSFWFSLSAFMQQGGDISPRSFSGRIVGGVWWFFTLIIVSSYTANLAAYLTVERMSTPIQSHHDLAKQSKIRYGVVNSGSSKEFFQKSTMPIFKKMYTFMQANTDVYSPSIDKGVERVQNSASDYAFLLESTMNEYYNQRLPCNTMKVGPNLDRKGYGIATPSGSPLRDRINLAVLEMKEKNRMQELRRKWWELKGECVSKDQKKSEKSGLQNSLNLENVRGLFYILAGGLGLGVTLSIFEFFYKCALEAKRRRRGFGVVVCEMMETSTKGKARMVANWSNTTPATPMSGLQSSGHPSPIPTGAPPQGAEQGAMRGPHEKQEMDYPY